MSDRRSACEIVFLVMRLSRSPDHAMNLWDGSSTQSLLVSRFHPRQIRLSAMAPSASHLSLAIKLSLLTPSSSSVMFETAWITVPGASFSRSLLLSLSTVTPIKSSIYTSNDPLSFASTGTANSSARVKGISLFNSSSGGIKLLRLDYTSVLLQLSHVNRSFVTSQITSDIKQKSGGQDDPPKGSRREMRTYHSPSIFTLTADQIADFAWRCILRYADLRSSFLINIFRPGYFICSATIWWRIRDRQWPKIIGSSLSRSILELIDSSDIAPGKDRSCVRRSFGT